MLRFKKNAGNLGENIGVFAQRVEPVMQKK
jgi:hypothetical protein